MNLYEFSVNRFCSTTFRVLEKWLIDAFYFSKYIDIKYNKHFVFYSIICREWYIEDLKLKIMTQQLSYDLRCSYDPLYGTIEKKIMNEEHNIAYTEKTLEQMFLAEFNFYRAHAIDIYLVEKDCY